MANPNQRKKSGNTIKPSAILRATGILFIVVAAAIVLFIRCPSASQYFIIYTLIGLAIAFLLFRSAQRSTASYKVWNISVGLSGGVILPVLLYSLNPIDSFKPTGCNMPVSVTVFVHGKKGRQDMILRQQGYVIMDINGERKRESINEKGQASFQNLHLGDKVLLNIDFSEPYKAIYPDSLHVITEEGRIYLQVALQGIDHVQGMVLYNEQPLPGVIIKINALSDTSNATGNFAIRIPDSLQSGEYKVWFIKKGFKARSVMAYPQTGQPLNIIMEK